MAPLSDIDKSLAVAIACTGDKKRPKKPMERPVDLVTLAGHLKDLAKEYRTQAKAADKINIKARTFGQLMASLDCDEKVQQLISARKIDSMDAVCKISQWRKSDQAALAKQVVKRELSSKDVRAIVKYRNDNPRISVAGAIKRVLDSKDRKTFTVLLMLDQSNGELAASMTVAKLLQKEFERVVGKDNLLSFEMRGEAMLVGVTPDGMKLLRQESKRLRIHLGNLANALVERAVSKKRRKK